MNKHFKQKQFLTYETGVALFSRNNICPYTQIFNSCRSNRRETKKKPQNRKKIITCFSQTCIYKHQAFYLLGQMAQAHWSHTFLVLLEDREGPLTSHLPPSFSERHQMPPTLTPPLSEHFTACMQRGELSPRKGKTRGFCPTAVPWHRTCSPVLPALSCSAEVAQAVPHSGSAAFRCCCIHPAISG